MWRFFNIMQFLDEFVCISTTGINNYAYSQLIDTTDKSALDVTEYSDEWNEVFEYLNTLMTLQRNLLNMLWIIT